MPSSDTPPRIPPPDKCPVCGSPEIKATVETNYGSYWRCTKCYHIWHQDREPRQKLPPFFERYWALLTRRIGRTDLPLRPDRLTMPALPERTCA